MTQSQSICCICKKQRTNESQIYCDNPACKSEVFDFVMQRVQKDPSGCWIWTGATAGSKKSPIVKYRGSSQIAPSRLIRFMHGYPAATAGQLMSRTCETKACVSPAHWLDDWERFQSYMKPQDTGRTWNHIK